MHKKNIVLVYKLCKLFNWRETCDWVREKEDILSFNWMLKKAKKSEKLKWWNRIIWRWGSASKNCERMYRFPLPNIWQFCRNMLKELYLGFPQWNDEKNKFHIHYTLPQNDEIILFNASGEVANITHFSTEFLESIELPGWLPHNLELKIGSLIILMSKFNL